MSLNRCVALLYLSPSVCFIQALKGLSHPATARRGNLSAWSAWRIAVAHHAALITQRIDIGTIGAARRRRRRRLARRAARRDDADARAGRVDALACRPGGGAASRSPSVDDPAAFGICRARSRPATGSSCSSARSSARSPSPAR